LASRVDGAAGVAGRCFSRDPDHRDTERRDQNVNAIASYLVADHINTLLAESAANRQAKLAKRTDRAKPLASVLTTVRSLLAAPADKPVALPTLSDYPYRS
jgi:hypothetical protein